MGVNAQQAVADHMLRDRAGTELGHTSSRQQPDAERLEQTGIYLQLVVIALRTCRPMRPKPLIPMSVAITNSPRSTDY